MSEAPPRILAITGGTGFVGQHLLRAALAAGHRLRALTRTPRADEPGIAWIHGSLDRSESLADLVRGADAVVHVAGLITGSSAAFAAVNVAGTEAMLAAASDAGIRRFVHISTLAAREPGLSRYGASKATAEERVRASGLAWTIVRPPAIYGPGDRETLELFRMAKRGFAVLPPRGRFSVIHVEDLCRLILRVLDRDETIGQLYEPDDGRESGWDNRHFTRNLARLLGRRATTVAAPRLVLRGVARLDRLVRRDRAKLTADRVGYFCHPDWVARVALRPPATLWTPQVHTPSGLKATADWYREQRWLR